MLEIMLNTNIITTQQQQGFSATSSQVFLDVVTLIQTWFESFCLTYLCSLISNNKQNRIHRQRQSHHDLQFCQTTEFITFFTETKLLTNC